MANTRKTLERVPDGKFEWKPDPKSMSMGQLAVHITMIPLWGKMTMDTQSFDVNPPGGQAWKQPDLKTRAEILESFDKAVPELRAAIAGASDQALMEQWSLLNGGKTVFAMLRVAVMRAMIMNHLIHHRAQLCVYYRLNGVAVPALYGPSADEPN
jgi:uncharacterized damage-inducible protein DinB